MNETKEGLSQLHSTELFVTYVNEEDTPFMFSDDDKDTGDDATIIKSVFARVFILGYIPDENTQLVSPKAVFNSFPSISEVSFADSSVEGHIWLS